MAALAGLGCALLFVLGVVGWTQVRSPGVDATLAGFDYATVKPERKSLIGALLTFLDRVVGGWALGQVSPSSRRKLRAEIARAGRSDTLTVEALVRRQSSMAFLMFVIGLFFYALTNSFLAMVLVPIGWILPRWRLRTGAKRRATDIERQLPDFLDILTVTISAGLGFRSALTRVSQRVEGAVSDEMQIALRQIELGMSRRQAFKEMKERSTAVSLNNFLTAFLQAEELGTPITGFLDAYSRELRRASGQRARSAAARANPKISIILTLVIMPAMCIFLIGSIVLVTVLKR